MTATQLQDALLFLAPGFVALKLFSLFGAQRARTQFESTVWSLLASVPLDLGARWLVRVLESQAGLDTSRVQTLLGVAPVDVARLVLAVAAAAVGVWAWKKARLYPLRLRLADSAWDWNIDVASARDRPIRAVMRVDDHEVVFRGYPGHSAREDTGAEPWLCLQAPQRQGEDGKFRQMKAIQLLVRRDKIERLLIYPGPDESAGDGTDATSTGAAGARLARRAEARSN